MVILNLWLHVIRFCCNFIPSFLSFVYLVDSTNFLIFFTPGRAQSRPFQSPPQSSHQSRGTFSHPADVRPSSSPSSGFTLPQLSANVVIILIAQYLSTLPENATICKDEIHQLIQNSKELFWQTHQENSTIQPFFLTIGKNFSLLLKYHTIQYQKIPYHKGPYNKIPCLTLPYLTLPYLTLPYLTLPYLTLPYLTLPYLTLPYLTLPYLTLPYLTLPYLTLPCLALPCLALPYRALPYLTLPYLTLPYLTLPYLTLPYLTLPYLTLPYLTLPYLTLPYLTLPYLTLPYLTTA